MGLSVSLLIAASFAILCTYYIGDKILVIDFSAYRPQNLKKAKLERLLAKKDTPTHVYDGSLVLGNMMLAAHSLGLSTCWIHRAKEEFESEEGKTLLKKWGIEGDYAGIGHCILGYAAEGGEAPAKPRKEDYVVRVQG